MYQISNDDGSFYSGFLFRPSVASHFCATARMTTAAGATHYDGVGSQSYGTTFEVVGYDTNNHFLPLVFAHSVGSECKEMWTEVFTACAEIPNFDIQNRTTIVDQEKSIHTAFNDCMQNAKLFLDPLHVKKNMSKCLGSSSSSERNVAINLYENALKAPTIELCVMYCTQYGPNQRAYLNKFDKHLLYRSYSNLDDLAITSQGAESQMAAAIRNHIRTVEPQKMIEAVVLTQRQLFLKQQQAASNCQSPVPPHVEKHLASLIQKSRV